MLIFDGTRYYFLLKEPLLLDLVPLEQMGTISISAVCFLLPSSPLNLF